MENYNKNKNAKTKTEISQIKEKIHYYIKWIKNCRKITRNKWAIVIRIPQRNSHRLHRTSSKKLLNKTKLKITYEKEISIYGNRLVEKRYSK
ncbi:hypothetical protein ACFL2Y_02365 [Candidatus Omnitrophota bacterium]